MGEICERCVLPLAGPPSGDFFSRRKADHYEPHMRILSEVLDLSFTLQDVAKKLAATPFAGSETCIDLGFGV